MVTIPSDIVVAENKPLSDDSDQSSQNKERKRSFLDIVNNPSPPNYCKREYAESNRPKLSSTSILEAEPVEPAYWIPSPNKLRRISQEVIEIKEEEPSLPPLGFPSRTAVAVSPSKIGLPSLSAIFGPPVIPQYHAIPAMTHSINDFSPYMLQENFYPPVAILNNEPYIYRQEFMPPKVVGGTERDANGRYIPSEKVSGDKGFFCLVEEPNEIQRKSYRNESRYLLPNPLTVALRNTPGGELRPNICEGTVNVRIINSDGNELPSGMNNILESLGGLTKVLDEEKSASFSLKVSATSIGSMYRLVFTVTYRIKGSPVAYTEVVLSQPFSVCSNRKKQLKELKERLTQVQRKN